MEKQGICQTHKNLCENLKRLRKSVGLSQASTADKLKVSSVTVSGWETGRKQPDYETLERLAMLYDVNVSDLFIGESSQPQSFEKGLSWAYVVKHLADLGLSSLIDSIEICEPKISEPFEQYFPDLEKSYTMRKSMDHSIVIHLHRNESNVYSCDNETFEILTAPRRLMNLCRQAVQVAQMAKEEAGTFRDSKDLIASIISIAESIDNEHEKNIDDIDDELPF